jgi:putative membrane protein
MKKHVFLLSGLLSIGIVWSAAAQSNLTDPQIAMIAVTADSIDIDAGKLAMEKSSNPKVKEFAQMMVRDHTAVNRKATKLAKKLNVTPEESDTSRSLKSDADKSMAKLRELSGAEFDKAYIDHEVGYHEAVIKVVNDTLVPNTKNPELKKLLEGAGPVFNSHLNHAKELQSSLH